MSDQMRIDWYRDEIGPFLARMTNLGEIVSKALEDIGQEVENTARSNAPWNDITGNARSGLVTEVLEQGDTVVLTLSHTEDYGKWLETIQDGRFAIILPTLERMGPDILRAAGLAVMGKEGGLF